MGAPCVFKHPFGPASNRATCQLISARIQILGKAGIGVLFGCFAGKIDGAGLPSISPNRTPMAYESR